MKVLIKLTILLSFVLGTTSCNSYLDVVPDDIPTLDDAFKNRSAAEKSLFSCYWYLPDPTNPFDYPAYFTSHDEFEMGYRSYLQPCATYTISEGNQNTNSPALNYWSGTNGLGIGKNVESMFEGIRTCNTFLEGINMPYDIDESERKKWIAEVKFLKAYYHFFLLQLYGPIPLIKTNLFLSSSPEEVRIFREPVDECIDYIVQLIDEAVPGLPLIVADPVTEAGRITQPIALSIKAKALVWAASPLFNGNIDYAGWTDKRGKKLVSSTYSKEKWVRATLAIKNAIDTCHLAGNKLYTFNKLFDGQTYDMNDTIAQTMTIRKAITERWNSGIIWSSMAAFSPSKGVWNYNYGNFQEGLMARIYTGDDSRYSMCFASFNMAEFFYSNKGIPIEEDESWGFGDRYKTEVSTAALQNENYILKGEISAHLNFNREPRFYADLGFDRGFYELSTETTDAGKTFKHALNLRYRESGSQATTTGYYVKKLVAYESSASRGGNFTFSGYDYRFPLIRLSDLYLLYSEALNEVKDAPDGEVYEWIDMVRSVAGLKGVAESWMSSNKPLRVTDKDEMRKIIQQERMIELAFEGQRFWDVRRWKIAEQLWTKPTKRWNYDGANADEYYVLKDLTKARKFTFRDYLWPIQESDLRVNSNLEQTYGW